MNSPAAWGLTYHYVLIREGLPEGVALAMTVHAAGESARMAATLQPDAHAAVLSATAGQLLELEARLSAAGIAHAAIREPDEPFNGELLAIGLPPQQRDPLKPFLRSFPTYPRRKP